MVTAAPGWVLLQTDFSSIEMAGLAQDCYSRQGYSRLRDVLNAKVCPHYFFAGVFTNVIKPEDLSLEESAVKELTKLLKEKVDKHTRSVAKVVNFGLPGGLSSRVLYNQMRIAGIDISEDETERLRNEWFRTFPEVKARVPEKMSESDINRYGRLPYRVNEDEEFEVDEKAYKKSLIYCSTNLSGRKRNRCSYTSALNYNFQSLVADGAKYAMWNLFYNVGLGPYIWNFVHDEVDYSLPEELVKTYVPVIQEQMIAGMKTVIPDVRVAVETTINRHWDKGGVDFTEATYDDSGKIIIPEIEWIDKFKNQGIHLPV